MIDKAYKLGCSLLALALMVQPVYAQDGQSAPVRTESGVSYEKPFHEQVPEDENDNSMPESHAMDRIADLDAAVDVWASRLGIEVDQSKVRETEAKALDSSPREVLLTRIDGDGEIDESFFDALARDDAGRQIVRLEDRLLHWDPAKREGIVKALDAQSAEGMKFFNVERRFRHSVTCAGDYSGFVFEGSGCEAGDVRDSDRRFVEQRKQLIGSSLHMKSGKYGAVYDWFGNDVKKEAVEIEKPVFAENPKDTMQREMYQHESWIKAELAKTKGQLAEEDMAVELGGQKIDARIGQLSQLLERLRLAASDNPDAADFISSAEQFLQNDLEALIEGYLQSRSENIEILHARKAELEKALQLVPGMQAEIDGAVNPEDFRPGIEKFVTWIQEAVRTLKIEKQEDEGDASLFALLDELIELGRGLEVEASHAREKAEQNELLRKAEILHHMIDESLQIEKIYEGMQGSGAALPEFEPAVAAVLELQQAAREIRNAQDVDDFQRLRQLFTDSRLENLEESEKDFRLITERFVNDLKLTQEKKRLDAEAEKVRLEEEAAEDDRRRAETAQIIEGIAASFPQHMEAVEKIQLTVHEFQNDIQNRVDTPGAFAGGWLREAAVWKTEARVLDGNLDVLKNGFSEMSERASGVVDLSLEDLLSVRRFIQERGAVLKPVYIEAKSAYKSLSESYHSLMAVAPMEIKPEIATVDKIRVEPIEEEHEDLIEAAQPVTLEEESTEEPEIEQVPVFAEPMPEPLPLAGSDELQERIIEDSLTIEVKSEEPQAEPAASEPSLEKTEAYYQKLTAEEGNLVRLELGVEDLKLQIQSLTKQSDFLKIRLDKELKLSRKDLAPRRARMPDLFKELHSRSDLNESIHAIISYRRELIGEKERFEVVKGALNDVIDDAISRDLEERKAVQSEIYAQLD